MKILVSGASGPIGTALLQLLRTDGNQVTLLTRSGPSGDGKIFWDPLRALDPAAVSGFDGVVHLAGESIVGRWTDAKKHKILESRELGTRHLAEALAAAPQKPRVLVSGSAMGFYGDRGDEVLNENSPSGDGFLPEVCLRWESAAGPAAAAGIRTVLARTGLVLSTTGGALAKMLTPFKLGVGGNVGNGKQWWSWIDVRDEVRAILHALKTEGLRGPVNLVAPNPATNAEFTKTLASVLHRPAIFPVPAFAAKLVFGQMADELLLASQRVQPERLLQSGYRFQFPELRASLEGLLKN